MRKTAIACLIAFMGACSSVPKTAAERPLYEVLVSKPDGGGNIHFYEILTTEQEIKMLQGDENIKSKITAQDLNGSSFIILNMGEKNSGGHSITVDRVEEKPDKIVVYVKEISPPEGSMSTQAITYPYAIVRINSKKPIEIK